MTLTTTDLDRLGADIAAERIPWRSCRLREVLADLREARALLAAVVRSDDPRVFDEPLDWCFFCEREAAERFGALRHTDDCAYVKGRAHLAAAGVEVG